MATSPKVSREREKIEDLSPAEKKQIRDRFGVPRMYELDTSVLSPPPPSEMIDRAANFLTKQKDKGFIASFEPDSYKKMFMRSQFQSEEKKRADIDLAKLYETEPFLRFWMNTKYMKDSLKQISRLPFPVVEDMKTIRTIFLEEVIATVRRMQSSGILDKQKRDDQMKAMRMFLEEAKEAKKHAIIYALDEHMITPERLPPEMLKAYEVHQTPASSLSPTPERRGGPKLTGTVAMPVRPESNMGLEHVRPAKRINRAMLGRNKQIVVPQMKQKKLELSPESRAKMEAAQRRRSEITLAQPVADGPTLMDAHWSTSGLAEENARRWSDEPEDVSASALANFDYIPNGKGDRFCESLQRVWNELGFTVKQRLAHVVKYTEDVSESAKLEDALHDWNLALSYAKRYERSYQEYKRMLRQTVFKITPEQMRIAKKAIETNAQSLEMIGRQLQVKFDDELIYRGVSVGELFQKRTSKIEELERRRETPSES